MNLSAPVGFEMAEGPGFEPGLTGPEPVVLPLDDPSVLQLIINTYRYVISQANFGLRMVNWLNS